MLRDRFGRVPNEARGADAPASCCARWPRRSASRRLLWRGDTYLVEYRDRVALERAPAGTELRAIRTGHAHLVLPRGRAHARAGARLAARALEGGRAGEHDPGMMLGALICLLQEPAPAPAP